MEDECTVLAADASQSQCCRCKKGRISVSVSYHMTALVPLLVLLTTFCRPTNAMCPTRCQCNDDELRASCAGAGLQVVPIQLNPELRHINLSHNKINSVHFTLEIYARLISLDVSNNKIQKLGSLNFMSQTQLNLLNLSNNAIEHLEKDVFKGLKSLQTLDLSWNLLEDISTSALYDLTTLETLQLTNNRLVSFEPELFKHQSNLRVLQLNDNQMLEIPVENLVYTTKLEELSMTRNLVEYIEEGSLPILKSLRYLALDTNVISEIHGSTFDGFPNLEILNLADNNFTTVPTVQLSKLSNLLELNLSGNFFTSIHPVAFRGLFKLRELFLNGVETLKRIDIRAFVDNINLERVSLDDNIDLAAIPTRLFHGNPRVTHISMRNNMLSTLEASHFPLDQLASLHIADNPLQCNCSLTWLWKLVTEQQNALLERNRMTPIENDTLLTAHLSTLNIDMELDVTGIQCAGPEHLAHVLLVDVPESDIRCSPNWVTVVTGSGVAICGLAVVFLILLYSGAFQSCGVVNKNKSYLRREQANDQTESAISERARDKGELIIGPPLLSEYQTLPTWETFGGSKNVDLYRQFSYQTNTPHPSRPHVVYV